MKDCIYMDHNATTPCAAEVVEAMMPWFGEKFGNAASRNHPYGWEAEEAVDTGRRQVAELFGVEPREIVFTSGATEAVNLALKGVFERYQSKGRHLVTVQTEHPAVLDTCRHLEKLGAEVTYLGVDSEGLLDLDELEDAIRTDTVLVAVMWANNETGVLQPMEAIGEICARKGTLLFSDATQAAGKVPVHPKSCGVHLLACSAHKVYGPKGVGALYVSHRKPRVALRAQIDGGGHERGFRSGTLNVPGIVGFGRAAERALHSMSAETERLRRLRDRLESALLDRLEEVYVNGHPERRLSHVSNLCFRFVEAEALTATFNRSLAVSTGSACSSASLEPSHVLLAMGKSEDWAHSSIRFSLGRLNTPEHIERAVELVVQGVKQLRERSPLWEMFKAQEIE